MEILQKRIAQGPNSTLSEYFVNKETKRRGYILEDKDRGLRSDMPLAELKKLKFHGETAIPTGRYRIQLRWSPSFKRFLPWLIGVPGYQYIYIHKGNWIRNTLGCLLVGNARGFEGSELAVHQSKEAFNPLYEEIFTAIDNKEEVWITIVSAYATPQDIVA